MIEWSKRKVYTKVPLEEVLRMTGRVPVAVKWVDVNKEHDKEGCILNRRVRWTEKGLEYEADPRQAEKLIEELGLNGANGLSTPAIKPSIGNIRADKKLPEEKVTHFRALAARANYFSADRPECQFAAK